MVSVEIMYRPDFRRRQQAALFLCVKGVVVMKKAVDFAIKNWRPLVLAYAIIAVAVFVCILIFFWNGWKETEQEKELWPDFEYDYPEESDWRKVCVICLSLFIALGCAVLWPGIPLIISSGILLVRLAERFPELFGNMLEMDPDEPEDPDAD